jgi:hypothetical protein
MDGWMEMNTLVPIVAAYESAAMATDRRRVSKFNAIMPAGEGALKIFFLEVFTGGHTACTLPSASSLLMGVPGTTTPCHLHYLPHLQEAKLGGERITGPGVVYPAKWIVKWAMRIGLQFSLLHNEQTMLDHQPALQPHT